MFAKAWKCPWALKPYCVPPHRQGSHVQAAEAQRHPPSQILKAGRVKATRWVPTAAEMKLMLLKLLHKNPLCCFFFFGPDLNVLRSWGAGVRGHWTGIKSGCTSPRCAAWRLKRWRADSSPALVPGQLWGQESLLCRIATCHPCPPIPCSCCRCVFRCW